MNRYLLTMGLIILGINLAEASIVKGTVCSAEDEGMIIGAEVTALVDSVQTLSARTGNRGSFSLDVPDGASRCTLTVSSTGYEPHTLSVANLSGDVDLGRILLTTAASTLGEVSVTASTTRVIDLPDKSIVFPTQLEKNRATDPLNLLAQISYVAPSLSVDEHGRSMTIDGRIPRILINGVRRSHDDLNALDPQDILKVEYITYPDIRYSAPYINIVTVRNPTGGSLMADLRVPVTTRKENHQLYASYRRGKHEVSVNYRGTFRDTRGDHTDLTERYFAPDRTYETELRGLPSRVLDRFHDASVEHSLVGGPKRMLVTTASIGYHSQDRDLDQLSTGISDRFRRLTVYDSRTVSPGLNIYGSLPVGGSGRLEMSLSGAYESGDHGRSMCQSDGYDESTAIRSGSYSLGGEVYYEHSFPWSKLTANVTHRRSHATNRYTVGEGQTRSTLHSNRTTASISLSGQIADILYYYASAGVTHNRVEEGNTSPYAYLMLRKKLRSVSLSYDFSTSSWAQGLSAYSDVVLPVNEILYQTGNMHLRDRVEMQNRLSATYSYRKFSSRLSVGCIADRNTPIKVYEYIGDPSSPLYGKFLETTGNGSRGGDFSTSLAVVLHNLLGHYSVRLEGSYGNMSSRGQGHRWRKAYFNGSMSAAAYFGAWQFGAWANPFPKYSLYGNFIWRERTSWGLSASWHRGPWAVGCQMADLFRRRAGYEEKTTMAMGSMSQSRSWMSDWNNWVSLSVRYQISFGREARKAERNVRGSTSTDSGVSIDY